MLQTENKIKQKIVNIISKSDHHVLPFSDIFDTISDQKVERGNERHILVGNTEDLYIKHLTRVDLSQLLDEMSDSKILSVDIPSNLEGELTYALTRKGKMLVE